jgi:hypothetical protein
MAIGIMVDVQAKAQQRAASRLSDQVPLSWYAIAPESGIGARQRIVESGSQCIDDVEAKRTLLAHARFEGTRRHMTYEVIFCAAQDLHYAADHGCLIRIVLSARRHGSGDGQNVLELGVRSLIPSSAQSADIADIGQAPDQAQLHHFARGQIRAHQQSWCGIANLRSKSREQISDPLSWTFRVVSGLFREVGGGLKARANLPVPGLWLNILSPTS